MRFTNATNRGRRAALIVVLAAALPLAVNAQLTPPGTGSTTGGSSGSGPRSFEVRKSIGSSSSSSADQLFLSVWRWIERVFSF
jgi:hypothetical protein